MHYTVSLQQELYKKVALNDFENTYTVAFVLKVAGLSNQFYYKKTSSEISF